MVQKFCRIACALLLLAPAAHGQARQRRPSSRKPQRETIVNRADVQVPRTYPSLQTQADEIGQAFGRGNFNRMVDLTYPKLVEILGGRARMVAFIESSVREMEAGGVTYLSTTVGDAREIITDGKQIYALVSTTMKMKVKEGVLVGESFMIGVSSDSGNNWTFVTATGDQDRDREMLRKLFPTIVDRLHIPARKPPVLYPPEKSGAGS